MPARPLPPVKTKVHPSASAGKSAPRIGIMGGTFNPIHYGHLVAAEEARCRFRLDEVVFVPSGAPPHKDRRVIIHPEHRYLMTVLATSANPAFSVSRIEIDRKGPTYTIDTIRAFRKRRPQPEVFFVTGCDAVMEILSWRDPEAILRLCAIIAASRPGYDFSGLRETVGAARYRKLRVLQIPALAISSTDIRHRVRNGLPVKYLVPESVEQYIYKNGLYA